MTNKEYSVQYEIEAFPTSITIELKCRDLVEATAIYKDRYGINNMKKVEILENGKKYENKV